MCSGSHDCSIEDEDFKKFADVWTKYLEQDIFIWKEFHEWWLKQNIPTHIIRYEDIVQRAPETLSNLMCFILNVKTIEGTQIKKYIELATQEKAPEIYKPRKGKVNGNLDKFTAENIKFLGENGGETLKLFGYQHLFAQAKEGEELVVPTIEEIQAPLKAHNEENLNRSIANSL